MAIENNAVVTSDLNENYPQDRDYISEGAAQIRLIKKVLKNTFPNVTSPLEINSDTLNIFANKINITGDAMDVGGLMIKNATPGTASNDIVTKAQMETHLTNFLRNNIYRVGSYYVSEDDTNPGDSAVLGFGTWVKVTGMLMGSGVVNPDGSVPNAQRREFLKGTTGGRVYNTIKAENIPLLTIDGSKFAVSQDTHSHTQKYNRGDSSGHNSDDNFLQPPNSVTVGEWTGTTSSYTHKHNITGSVTIGRDDISRQPIDTMPPYRVTNIWRRSV